MVKEVSEWCVVLAWGLITELVTWKVLKHVNVFLQFFSFPFSPSPSLCEVLNLKTYVAERVCIIRKYMYWKPSEAFFITYSCNFLKVTVNIFNELSRNPTNVQPATVWVPTLTRVKCIYSTIMVGNSSLDTFYFVFIFTIRGKFDLSLFMTSKIISLITKSHGTMERLLYYMYK